MRRHRRNYRGSRSRTGVLIPVLIVLCIIAAGVLYFVNDSEIYTKNGDSIVVAETKKGEDGTKEADVVIEKTDGDSEKSESDDVVLKEEKKATCGYFIKINEVRTPSLFDEALLRVKNETNINTLVIEVKAEDGNLAFSYDHDFIKDKNLSGKDDDLKTAMQKARENGFSVALYVSCFKDNGAAHSNFENAIKQKDNGWIWRDETDMRWLSAYSEASQEYITKMIEKLVTFAPDEIILANVSFPARGNASSIDYGEETRGKTDALSEFLEKTEKAAGKVSISAIYDNYSANLNNLSGQDISVFKNSFKALYVKKNADENTLSFETAKTAVADDSYRLIPIVLSNTADYEEFIIKK